MDRTQARRTLDALVQPHLRWTRTGSVHMIPPLSDHAVSSELKSLDDSQIEKFFRAGSTILSQGETGSCAYFILSGRVSISVRREDNTVVEVGTRSAGNLIGEMAIVDDGVRSATVVAMDDCHLLEISKADFSKALANASPLVALVTRLILLRYRDVLLRTEDLKGLGNLSDQLEHAEQHNTELSQVLASVKVANEFRLAIANDQLFLEYQPLVSLKDKSILGIEALMRWQHPVHGRMPPDDFIPMAEDTGLIVDATWWVFEHALIALRRLHDKTANRELFVSVNVSAQDFNDPAMVDRLLQMIDKNGLEPRHLHLEITERLLLRQSDQVRGLLNRCRQSGMSIAIDDFGTGYSALSYLHTYPVSTLKIDKSFVGQMLADKQALGLVRSILSLGDNMALSVFAEGVETEDQANTLLSLDCQIAQGFYFARPMPEEQLLATLLEQC